MFIEGVMILADYDYKAGKKRIKDILNNKLEVIEQGSVPADKDFTFNNGYYSWVTGIFVDIRDSSELFSNGDKEQVSKIIRSFTSEIIEILRKDDDLREIGIRGDCVYGVYTTPYKINIYEKADKTFWINTYFKMLNKLLSEKKYPNIKAGIGMSTAQELVVKAGRKDTGINNKVWIGEAVAKAANLSSLANKNGLSPIAFSKLSYSNFIDELVNKSGEKAKGWFNYRHDDRIGYYYDVNLIKNDFYSWINNGMID